MIDQDVDALESFTCSVFGYSKLTSINDAKYLHLRASENQKKQQSH